MLYKFCVLTVANIFKEILLMFKVCKINVRSTIVTIGNMNNADNFKLYFIISQYSDKIVILQNLHAENEKNLILDARKEKILYIF